MKTNRGGRATEVPAPVRCAIYTRKSTTEGLDSDFSSLDAQRDAAEHYVQAQAAARWEILPTHYDDGGFSGANLERPALQRLLGDIGRGRVDMVVVYKVDRLSRSLLDFARLMERFEKSHVGLVSITQHFDTSSSMGRLTLNVLLSFAQFEREMVSERTRDKIAGARRRGKWTGGVVMLGYELDRERGGIRVVPEEAEVVRLAFDLYLRIRSVGAVAARLNALGHTQKVRTTADGKRSSGRRWSPQRVHYLLTNPIYTGKVRGSDGELFAGQHEAIVSEEVFDQVAAILALRTTGKVRRDRRGEYLLSGLLRCGPCGCRMTASAARGTRGRYLYYRCRHHLEVGASGCPTGLLSAQDVEQAVVNEIARVARDGNLRREVLARLAEGAPAMAEAQASRARIEGRLAELRAEGLRLVSTFDAGSLVTERVAQIERDMEALRRELGDLEARLAGAEAGRRRADTASRLLEEFKLVWDAMVPDERRDLLNLLIKEIVVDLDRGGLHIDFHDLGAATVRP